MMMSPAETKYRLQRTKMHYLAIKDYFLKSGKTEQQWQTVCQDPRKFNRVWRAMLQIPPGDMPPPAAFR
jgi:O6-methylguanine-DNA--protein-cysteine methyltransferase